MLRWIFAMTLIGSMVALGCGLDSINFVSAEVEHIAFVLVPVVFMVGSVIGLGLSRQG